VGIDPVPSDDNDAPISTLEADMLVQDLMVLEVETIPEDLTCAAAARRMREQDLGLLIVVSYGKLAGVVTDRGIAVDCVGAGLDPQTTPVNRIMASATYAARPDAAIDATLHRMREFGFRRLPVIEDNGTVVGVISMADIAPYVRNLVDDLLVETAEYTRAPV
jgi:CBS domain-containing protein